MTGTELLALFTKKRDAKARDMVKSHQQDLDGEAFMAGLAEIYNAGMTFGFDTGMKVERLKGL